jgi:TetR/AcrR family transcriptional regulator, regulator of cefoperazone and chloramphenicol sensitivity
MRSSRADIRASAVIRDEALRLFAARGPDAVTVREIAAAAEVSPALVIHHFGSKDGLRDAVDEHVLAIFEAMLGELSREDDAGLRDPAAAGSLAAAVTAHLPADSPAPAYLRRLLLDGTPAGHRLFRRLYEASSQAVAAMTAAGLLTPGPDPAVRAAFLMVNDLAVILLRDHLAELLGTDPLTSEGMARWGREVLTVYATGLLAPPQGGT